MSWEGPEPGRDERTVSGAYLDELYAKADRLRVLEEAARDVVAADGWSLLDAVGSLQLVLECR